MTSEQTTSKSTTKKRAPAKKTRVKKEIKRNNYAFIDNENVNISVIKQGRKIDWTTFRNRLKDERDVSIAYMFMGYLPEYQEMYTFFQNIGYTLIFKPMNMHSSAPHKGNVDAELVLQAMIDIKEYDQAVIVSGDGDFSCLVHYLYKQKKLGTVIVPNEQRYSDFLDYASQGKLVSLTSMKEEMRYLPGKTTKKKDVSYYDKFYD